MTGGNGSRVLTKAEYDNWLSEIRTRPAPTTRKGLFPRKYAGQIERKGGGGGAEFWTDDIEDSTILEAKLIKDAQRSPFIVGSDIPDIPRVKIVAKVDGEFERTAKIINDPTNPLKSVEVIVSDERAIPFFEGLLKKHGIPGKVVVKPE